MNESVDQLLEEGLVSATDAARSVGLRVSVWTLLRWIRRGVRAKRLEALKVGGRWFTSVAAVRRFLDCGTHPPSRGRQKPGEDQKRGTAQPSRATERYLDSIGLGRKAAPIRSS